MFSLSLHSCYSRIETAKQLWGGRTWTYAQSQAGGPVWSLLNVFSGVKLVFERWQRWEWSNTLQMLCAITPSLELLQLVKSKLFPFVLSLVFFLFLSPSLPPLPHLVNPSVPCDMTPALPQNTRWAPVINSKVPSCPGHILSIQPWVLKSSGDLRSCYIRLQSAQNTR